MFPWPLELELSRHQVLWSSSIHHNVCAASSLDTRLHVGRKKVPLTKTSRGISGRVRKSNQENQSLWGVIKTSCSVVPMISHFDTFRLDMHILWLWGLGFPCHLSSLELFSGTRRLNSESSWHALIFCKRVTLCPFSRRQFHYRFGQTRSRGKSQPSLGT